MKFFIYLIIFIIILFILINMEIDRRIFSPFTIKSYYTDSLNIFQSIYNNINRLQYYKKHIYNSKNFKFDSQFKSNIHKIRKNFLNFYSNNEIIRNDQLSHHFGLDPNYKIIYLKYFKNLKILRKFPFIFNILNDNPNIHNCFISIMENKKKTLPYHKGTFNGLLRYHIPIIINKKSDSYIEVLGRYKLKYKENESFVFDDTYPHKLEKKDNYLRAVIICDVERKKNSFLKNQMFKYLINKIKNSKFINDIIKLNNDFYEKQQKNKDLKINK